MSYNEHMWSQINHEAKTSTNSEAYKKLARKHLTPEQFIKVYSLAFLEYIDSSLGRKSDAHIEDIIVWNSMFADAFHHVIVALDTLEK